MKGETVAAYAGALDAFLAGKKAIRKYRSKHKRLRESPMKAEIIKGNLVLTLPIEQSPSKSGKSIVVASSRGNKATTATVDGKPVIVGVNAYIQK